MSTPTSPVESTTTTTTTKAANIFSTDVAAVGSGNVRKGPTDHVNELKDLVVSYAKQETIDPLFSLKRTMSFGMSGAVCIGLGVSLALLGMLRGLQEIDLFSQDGPTPGAWTLVPYAATLLAAAVVIALAGLGAKRAKAAKHRVDPGGSR